jgi:hypothetical protein
MCRKFEVIGELLLFGQIPENVKKENLLQIMCFQFQVLEFLPRASRYGGTLFALSLVKSWLFCHVDITAKGGCVSRVGGSGSEGDTGTTVNSGNTSLFHCSVNVATSP